MKKFTKNFVSFAGLILTVFLFSPAILAQQVQRPTFDVTNYLMDVQLAPNENRLNATADVTFTPLEDTRAVTFELNG